MSDSNFTPPDRSRPEPLWLQVEQTIRAAIAKDDWPAGHQIPPEERLCTLLGVSRITLRHALRNLELKGFLRREHGRGTFVRNKTLVVGTRELMSFTQALNVLGLTIDSKVLDWGLGRAGALTAAALRVDQGTEIVRMRRLRLGDGEPIGLQSVELLSSRVPGLLDGGPVRGSLYEMLETRYGIVPREASEVFRVAIIHGDDADRLAVPPNSPAFMVERISQDERGPFEFTQSVIRGDRYEIRSTLLSADFRRPNEAA